MSVGDIQPCPGGGCSPTSGCGSSPAGTGADLVKIDTDLVELLERIRTAACGAVTVNSGYRTAYNQKVGGARPASTCWAGRRIFR